VKRKGINYILDAIDLLESEKKILFVYAGNKKLDVVHKYPLQYIGALSREELPDFYRICDLFINASIQDVGPYMILEALLCGIPVISFDTGLASDYVITDQTGILLEEQTSEAIAEGISSMLQKSESEIEMIKKKCVSLNLSKLTYQTQIKKLNKLLIKDHLC